MKEYHIGEKCIYGTAKLEKAENGIVTIGLYNYWSL